MSAEDTAIVSELRLCDGSADLLLLRTKRTIKTTDALKCLLEDGLEILSPRWIATHSQT